jgi:redox-sensitive bicupin YhaK (pirin superfamily)
VSTLSELEHLPEALETVIAPRTQDLGDGFEVRRALPSARRRMVGPFIFLDQMGPAVFRDGRGLDVRPHPHIGLATVTYLFEGNILHRDSLGTVQTIRPGEVNWMTAGRGIAHSERTPLEERAGGGRLSGIQMWVALPKRDEESEPAFAHYDASQLPELDGEGAKVRLIAGALWGKRSPVRTSSDLVYADVMLVRDARLSLPADYAERALYIADGAVEVAGTTFRAGELLVLRPGHELVARGAAPTRMLLLGGEPMDGPRYIDWNFVSSSRERLEQAKADWRAGRFAPVPQETEFIPLPEDPAPVRSP